MGTQRQLPPIIDFGDALDRVESRTDDAEAHGYIDEIRDGIGELAARDPDSRETQIQELEHLIDSLLMYVDDDAEMWTKTIQNRFANYRHARRESSRTLHVANGRLERDGELADITAVGEAALRGQLINNGERSDAMVSLAFYDERDRAIWKVESREFEIAPGEKRTLDLDIYIPDGASYYAVAALEPSDPATVAADAPTPGKDTVGEDTSYVDYS